MRKCIITMSMLTAISTMAVSAPVPVNPLIQVASAQDVWAASEGGLDIYVMTERLRAPQHGYLNVICKNVSRDLKDTRMQCWTFYHDEGETWVAIDRQHRGAMSNDPIAQNIYRVACEYLRL